MTRNEAEVILRANTKAAVFTWSWIEVNEKDPKRANVSILRIIARGGGMHYLQDFTEKFLTEHPTSGDVLGDALKAMWEWVVWREAMAAQAERTFTAEQADTDRTISTEQADADRQMAQEQAAAAAEEPTE